VSQSCDANLADPGAGAKLNVEKQLKLRSLKLNDVRGDLLAWLVLRACHAVRQNQNPGRSQKRTLVERGFRGDD
jgi:hypothetical protein